MTRSRRARLWGCGMVLAAGLGWWTSPGRCGTVSFNPQGMAVLAAAAAPGQRVEVGRVYFDSYRRNLYAGLPAWDLFMQPASDRLQGDLGDLPLSRLTWSLVRYPGYTTVVPPTPLGPGNVHVARIQWGGMHEMRWWFEPQPWDTAGAEPYTVPILYTVSVTDVDARAFVYLAFPNPFDPDAGQPLRVWVRYGQWADDQGTTSVTAILGVVPSNRPFEAGGSEPYCTASAVYSYGTTLSLVNRNQPPWIHPDWFEMTWDGRTTAGQPVPDGDYCLAILFSPPGAAVVEVPLRVARSGRAGTALRVQVVQSAGGQPVENATVHVAGPGGVEGRQLVTGPDGVAVVQGLARERYLVWADAPGYQPARAWVDLTQRSASAG
ncbi:MAG TPA: carboxypeptidase-like regulatory domain-containing protein, partial [Limnochordales bacterium]